MNKVIKFVDRHMIVLAIVILFATVAVTVLISQGMKHEAEKQERIAQDIKNEQAYTKYNTCLYQAAEDYMTNWNGQCEGKKLEDNCLLPTYLANDVDETLEKDQATCLEIYKLELK